MLLILAGIRMKDSQTDRHKRAFWDLLQLQEAASPSKFATWQWWRACLIPRWVSPRVCTCKHNRECVQSPYVCLTTSLVCLCLRVLRLLSSVCLSWRGETGGRVVEGSRHHMFRLLRLRKRFNVLGCRYALWMDDNGERVDNSQWRHEDWLVQYFSQQSSR